MKATTVLGLWAGGAALYFAVMVAYRVYQARTHPHRHPLDQDVVAAEVDVAERSRNSRRARAVRRRSKMTIACNDVLFDSWAAVEAGRVQEGSCAALKYLSEDFDIFALFRVADDEQENAIRAWFAPRCKELGLDPRRVVFYEQPASVAPIVRQIGAQVHIDSTNPDASSAVGRLRGHVDNIYVVGDGALTDSSGMPMFLPRVGEFQDLLTDLL